MNFSALREKDCKYRHFFEEYKFFNDYICNNMATGNSNASLWQIFGVFSDPNFFADFFEKKVKKVCRIKKSAYLCNPV